LRTPVDLRIPAFRESRLDDLGIEHLGEVITDESHPLFVGLVSHDGGGAGPVVPPLQKDQRTVVEKGFVALKRLAKRQR
jgi:hypothetical protein